MFKAAIITASDKGYKGLREDLSGSCIKKILEEANYEVVSIDVLPDERNLIADKLIELSDKKIPLIFTTGGTGFSPRDNTPEATRDIIEKETPGISSTQEKPGEQAVCVNFILQHKLLQLRFLNDQ